MKNRGESLAIVLPQGLERNNPLTHAYRHRGGGRDMIGDLSERATGPTNLENLENRGEPPAKFWSRGEVRPPAPSQAPAFRDSQFGQQGIPVPFWIAMGGVDTCIVYLHPPTRLDLLVDHPLPRKAYRQRGGSH